MIRSYSHSERSGPRRAGKRLRIGERGFTLPELLVGLLVAAILAAVALPMYNTAMNNMRMNGTATAISGAVSRTRYQAVMTSQTYTIAITAPANTYVVKNLATGVAAASVPLPNPAIAINTGTAATYTFTFNANGTVTGAGGGAIPALVLTYAGHETDITVSGVGNVTTKTVY
jgi:type IV fimbrial biogenesis protein FimT